MKSYRHDIDGLRAIAVLAVVFFHLNPKKFSGGFLGVDIFFVISGFLIIGLSWQFLKDGTFSFSDFYAKRVRRLFPAFFTVLAVSTLIVSIIGLPHDIVNFAKSALASTFYVSNIYFWHVSDYFNDLQKLDPLLHTWSLSVEEQFYLILPGFLFLIFKLNPRFLFAALTGFAVATFILSQYLLSSDPSLSFYLSVSRFWQFILGGLVAVCFVPNKIVEKYASAFSAIALIVLLVCIFEYSDEMDFPGVNALLPTLATCLLIYAGAFSGNKVSVWLASKPMKFFGDISYSLYLWHWPLIIFYKMYWGFIDTMGMLIIFAGSVGLSWLSLVFIEQPFRRLSIKAHKSTIYFFALGCMLFATVFMSCLIYFDGFKGRYSVDAMPIVKYLESVDNNQAEKDCFWRLEDGGEFDKATCVRQVDGVPNILLLGDSHMEHYAKAFETVFPDVAFSRVAGPGCRPLLPVKKSESCKLLMEPVFEQYLSENKYDLVILAGRWKTSELPKLNAALDVIKPKAGAVVVIGPVIEYRLSFPRLLLRYLGDEHFDIKVDHQNQYSKIAKIDKALQELTQQKNVDYFSPLATMCSDEGKCLHLVHGEPVHIDYGHLSFPGAVHLVQKLEEQFSEKGLFVQ